MFNCVIIFQHATDVEKYQLIIIDSLSIKWFMNQFAFMI